MILEDKYTVIKSKDMSGSITNKECITIKTVKNIRKKDIIDIAKVIINERKYNNEYLMIRISDNENVINEKDINWDVIAHWKRVESTFNIHSILGLELEFIDDIYFEFRKKYDNQVEERDIPIFTEIKSLYNEMCDFFKNNSYKDFIKFINDNGEKYSEVKDKVHYNIDNIDDIEKEYYINKNTIENMVIIYHSIKGILKDANTKEFTKELINETDKLIEYK